MPDSDKSDRFQDTSAYAGRWIAEIGGRIVAQGGTPEQAERAALAQRHKEKPRIRYIPMTAQFLGIPYFEKIQAYFTPGEPFYIVGGAVRDMLLGIRAHDIDFILPKDALKIARIISNQLRGSYFPLDEERGIARVVIRREGEPQTVLDFALFQGPDLEGDLHKRDFTINAIAIDGHDPTKILDPLGGASDLQAKLVRVCSPNSIKEDPLRILRGVRLAANYDLRIDPETRQLMKTHASGLAEISPERIRDELFYILDSPRPAAGVQALQILGALTYIAPEIPRLKSQDQSPPHITDVFAHTLDVVRKFVRVFEFQSPGFDPNSAGWIGGLLALRLGRFRSQINEHYQKRITPDRSLKALLLLSALYHDAGKPRVADVDERGLIRFFGHEIESAEIIARRGRELRLSSQEVERLQTIVRHHMRPLALTNTARQPSRKAIYRFYRDTQAAGVDICLLSLADLWATYGHTLPQDLWSAHLDTVQALLEAYWEQEEEKVNPPRLVNGKDLIETLKLKPGPEIGRILEAVREAQAVGKITDRVGAIKFAKELLETGSDQG